MESKEKKMVMKNLGQDRNKDADVAWTYIYYQNR